MELERLTVTVLLWAGALPATALGERSGREFIAATGFMGN